MKVLHVVENLDKGAVENWLMGMAKSFCIQPNNMQWDFYCILGKPGLLDEEARALGSNIYYNPVTISAKWKFLRHLRGVVKKGKYDVVHSHHDFLSGFYTCAFWFLKIPKRIIHVHNTDCSLPVGSKWLQKLALRPFAQLAVWNSTNVVCISHHVANHFTVFPYVGQNNKISVIYNGVQFKDLLNSNGTKSFNNKLFTKDTGAKKLLFVGRLNDLKNPMDAIDLLHHRHIMGSKDVLVFIGEGYLEGALKKKAKDLCLTEYCDFVGWQSNVALWMHHADLLIFPRLFEPMEGLGMVMLEAQALGLPVLTTIGVSDEVVVLSDIVKRYEHLDMKKWALDFNEYTQRRIHVDDSVKAMETSQFGMAQAKEALQKLYGY